MENSRVKQLKRWRDNQKPKDIHQASQRMVIMRRDRKGLPEVPKSYQSIISGALLSHIMILGVIHEYVDLIRE